ncbi:MAG TPA: DnaD domain protein [Limnochordia bacterium]|nr:DnaD domain protein [Limnochordia bacterium]
MAARDALGRVSLGRRQRPPIAIPDALFRQALPELGPAPALVWMVLRWWAEDGAAIGELVESVAQHTGLTSETVEEALLRLEQADLLRVERSGFVLNEPLGVPLPTTNGSAPPPAAAVASSAAPAVSTATTTARAARRDAAIFEPVAAEEPGRAEAAAADVDEMQAVADMYHRRIGLLGPSQYERLRFWIDEQGMRGDVVALAIEETMRGAKRPSIAYLEGVLRNWHNDGVRTMQDLLAHPEICSVIAEQSGNGQPVRSQTEGRANASAYTQVQADAVQRWKELYPDEYGD